MFQHWLGAKLSTAIKSTLHTLTVSVNTTQSITPSEHRPYLTVMARHSAAIQQVGGIIFPLVLFQ